MRCPDCGGLNPAEAQWCGQCMKRFVSPPSPPVPVGAPVAPPAVSAAVAAPVAAPREAPRTGAPSDDVLAEWAAIVGADGPAPAEPSPEPTALNVPAAPSAPAAPNAPRAVKRGAFAVADDGITWECRLCETSNSLDVSTCTVCGSSFGDTVREPEPERPQRDPNTTALYSLLLPGAGHAYLGLWGEAVSRGVVTAFSALVFLISALTSGPIVVTAAFALASFALWGVAAHDAYREASDNRGAVLLRGRQVMYVMLGLLGLMFVLMMISFVQAKAAG